MREDEIVREAKQLGQEIAELRQRIKDLSGRRRQLVVELHEIHHRSYPHIAKELDLTAGRISQIVNQAK
jgi:DNA-directed RNA polymerase specialized sigma24 family protein